MMIDIPPMNCARLPDGRLDTLLRSILLSSNRMKNTVSTANAHVNHIWMRTIVACPSRPMTTVTPLR